MKFITKINAPRFAEIYRPFETGFISRPGYDTAPITIVATRSENDYGPIATVFYDAVPVLRTTFGYDRVLSRDPDESAGGEPAVEFYGTRILGTIDDSDDRESGADFLGFTDAIGYTNDAENIYRDDSTATVGGTVEDSAKPDGLDRFVEFIDAIRAAAFDAFNDK